MPARSVALTVFAICCGALAVPAALAQLGPPPLEPPSATAPAAQPLKSPAEFEAIGDKAERSRAMFTEIAKVLTHPRCMNCHPAGEHALQGAGREHNPQVWRHNAETGAIGTTCSACHTEANVTLHEGASYKSIPGHPRWELAPKSMAWEGKSIGDICRQVKDVTATAGATSRCCTSISPRTIWSPGAGIRARAVSGRRARRKKPASWSRHGSTAERSARNASRVSI